LKIDFYFLFYFMGKTVCFANGMLPREDTNWKSGHKLQTTIKINKNFCNNPEVEPKTLKTNKLLSN